MLLVGRRRGMAEKSGGVSVVGHCNNVPLGRWCKGRTFGGAGNLRPTGEQLRFHYARDCTTPCAIRSTWNCFGF